VTTARKGKKNNNSNPRALFEAVQRVEAEKQLEAMLELRNQLIASNARQKLVVERWRILQPRVEAFEQARIAMHPARLQDSKHWSKNHSSKDECGNVLHWVLRSEADKYLAALSAQNTILAGLFTELCWAEFDACISGEECGHDDVHGCMKAIAAFHQHLGAQLRDVKIEDLPHCLLNQLEGKTDGNS